MMKETTAGRKAQLGKHAPDCGECTHYYITYDPSFPYGCRTLGFKGKRKPHLDVLEASGTPCLAFLPKAKTKLR